MTGETWRLVAGAVGFLDVQYYHGDGYWDMAEVVEGSEQEAAFRLLIAEATWAREHGRPALEEIMVLLTSLLRSNDELWELAYGKVKPLTRAALAAHPTNVGPEDIVAALEARLAAQETKPRQLCESHPDVDYRSQWGCPECVAELRTERDAAEIRIRELEGVLEEVRNGYTKWKRYEKECEQIHDAAEALKRVGAIPNDAAAILNRSSGTEGEAAGNGRSRS